MSRDTEAKAEIGGEHGLHPLHFARNCAQWNAAPAGQPRLPRIGRRPTIRK